MLGSASENCSLATVMEEVPLLNRACCSNGASVVPLHGFPSPPTPAQALHVLKYSRLHTLTFCVLRIGLFFKIACLHAPWSIPLHLCCFLCKTVHSPTLNCQESEPAMR